MEVKLKKEHERRKSVLKGCGLDVEGFVLLTTLSLYGELECFGWGSRVALNNGLFKLAHVVSGGGNFPAQTSDDVGKISDFCRESKWKIRSHRFDT